MCELHGGNPFTVCTYIKSSHGTLQVYYSFICELQLKKAEKKKYSILHYCTITKEATYYQSVDYL